MKVPMTEYLQVDLEREMWMCRVCATDLGPARSPYKEGLLVYARDPREIHKPILNPELYEFTFAPDPKWVQILEYYCPDCGTLMEAEYLPPGHPPVNDMEFDLDALKKQWNGRKELSAEELAGPDLVSFAQHTHSHKQKTAKRAGRES
jgi:acetone carboxylase gamma subunit